MPENPLRHFTITPDQPAKATRFTKASRLLADRRRMVLLSAILTFVLLMTVFGSGLTPQLSLWPSEALASGSQIYWGGYLDGEHYGYGDAPWDERTLEKFEQHAGKPVSIIHWGQAWHWSGQSGYPGIGDGFFQKFETQLYERVRQRGSIPMISWHSSSNDAGDTPEQPDYQLIDIINGTYDTYIRQWARDARDWGKPFFLRFDHEMNGRWFPWNEQVNGNQPGQYIQMWRHVVDLFAAEGADNVTWVWSVNAEYDGSTDLSGLFPGDDYVDWAGISGYNWGTNPTKPDRWKTFSELFSQTYDRLGQVAPGKPVMISEFASTEYGGSKAGWLMDAFTVQLPQHFPKIEAIVWFNWNAYEYGEPMDWIIESSSAAQSAFAAGIGDSYYAANNFSGLNSYPIWPISELPGDYDYAHYLPAILGDKRRP